MKTPGSTVSLYLSSSVFHRVSRRLGNVAIDQDATRPDTYGGGLPGTKRMRIRATHLPACSFVDTVHCCVLLRFICPYLSRSSSLTYFVLLQYLIRDRINVSVPFIVISSDEYVIANFSKNYSHIFCLLFYLAVLSYFRPLLSFLHGAHFYTWLIYAYLVNVSLNSM